MNKKVLLSSALLGAFLGAPQAAFAQDGAAGHDTVGEIVVTARRTEESLQITPVAVTALGVEALAQAQVADVSDLQRTAPGLTVARGSSGTSGFTFVAIRGQGNLQPILGFDPAVATYVDGVYIPRPSAGLADLQDLQRLEVLRGPQGTLFGRNTTGGALNIITRDPDEELGGEIGGEVGDFNTLGLNAAINIPIAENLAGRFTYGYRSRDGYGHNPIEDRDLWDLESHFLRGKVKYEGDDFSVTISGDYNRMEDQGQLVQLLGVASGSPAFTPYLHTSGGWHDSYGGGTHLGAAITGSPANLAIYNSLPSGVRAMYDQLPYNELEAFGFSATVEAAIGAFEFKSITGYRDSRNEGLIDTDATPIDVLATYSGSDSDYISQEFQISGNIIDSLSFITGVYYGHEEGEEYSRSQIGGGLIRDSTADVEGTTTGAYAQFYYDITSDLRAVAGYRYTWDTRDTVLHNAQVLGLAYNAPLATPTGINCTVAAPDSPPTADTCDQTQEADFEYPAWTLGLDWQVTEDLFLYVKTSAASKAGGWNLRAGGLPAFEPEEVQDVEIGVKADLFDNRLRVNVAAFQLERTDGQAVVNAFVPGIGVTQYLQNNGDAEIDGIEIELTARPWRGLEVTANASFVDGKYKEGTFNETQRFAPTIAPPPGAPCTLVSGTTYDCVVDLSGQPLLQTPETQFNLGATQTFRFDNADLKVHFDYAFVGEQYFNAPLASIYQNASVQAAYAREAQLGRVSGYGLINGRISYELTNPNVEIALFGRNLTNNQYVFRTFSDLWRSIGFATEYSGEPRVVGVEVNYRF